jgi:arsenite transporter
MGPSSPNLSSNNTINGHFPADPELEKTKEKEAANLERQSPSQPQTTAKKSVYQSLGWLDRLLALWILLAIIIGILLGNYVHSVGPALQRGKFVQVSVPIGTGTLLKLGTAFC